MLENVSMATQVNKGTKSIQSIGTIPETEVRERAVRRRFTAEYKLRILKEAESCTKRGQLGALLRREGLYSTNLITWRRQMEKGTLEACYPGREGQKLKDPIHQPVALPNLSERIKDCRKSSGRQRPL